MWDSFCSALKMLRIPQEHSPNHRIDVRWSCLMVKLHHCWKLIRRHQIIVSARSNLLQIPCSLSRPEDGFMPQDLYNFIYKVTERPWRAVASQAFLRSINRDTRIRVLVAVCHRMCKRLGWDRWKSVVSIDRMLFCCIFCCSERGWWNWWWLEQKDERVSDFTSNHCLFEDSLLLIMKSHVPHDHGTILDGR